MKRQWLILCALGLLIGGFAFWRLSDNPLSHEGGIADATPPVSNAKVNEKVETPEQQARRKLVGVWQDEYQGKRTMTLNADGSGTMLVELGGVQALLFASKLRFDMKWTKNGNQLTKTTVGGEPAEKVNLLLKTMGNTAEDTILENTNDRLLLLDKNGTTKYDWKRLKTDEPGKEKNSSAARP